MVESVSRFSNRVENYAKYRPGYPAEVVSLLEKECGLNPGSIIADIGSGTGILSEIFLKNGNKVFGVEPGREMRSRAELALSSYPNFLSINGTAEDTTLPAGSVDFITAAQAFHWFDLEKSRKEFARILKPGGWTVLLWNERRLDSTPFLVDYEKLLLRWGTDYAQVRHENVASKVSGFYAPQVPFCRTFDNVQNFDFEGLRGRLESASYTPAAGHPNYEPMINELRALFDGFAVSGRIAIEYDTRVYYGHLY